MARPLRRVALDPPTGRRVLFLAAALGQSPEMIVAAAVGLLAVAQAKGRASEQTAAAREMKSLVGLVLHEAKAANQPPRT